MCRRVQCDQCQRPTYAGCGAHIEQVLGDVPPSERCRCREERAKAAPTTSTSGRTAPESMFSRVTKFFSKG